MTIRQMIKSSFPGLWSTLRRMRQRMLNLRSPTNVFTDIYHANSWGDDESRSGPGSNMENTRVVREFLPEFLNEIKAKSLLDLPCGDLYWMKTVDLGATRYIGGDIVPEVIESNRQIFADSDRQFEVLDIVKDALPDADVLLCRDCFIHLPNKMVETALERICNTSFRYLITSTFVEIDENIDIELGGFRAVNLQKPPFLLPEPEQLHREGGHEGKSIAVWSLDRLKQHFAR